jgi:hypothetical protein
MGQKNSKVLIKTIVSDKVVVDEKTNLDLQGQQWIVDIAREKKHHARQLRRFQLSPHNVD